MRKSAKIFTALSVAGLAVAAGSAFTATSTIDVETQHVGAIGQLISGVSVTAVEYTVGTGDMTTGVEFQVAEDLDAEFDTVAATIKNAADPVVTQTDSDCTVTPLGAGNGTTVTCDFVGVNNVTSLSIVAS